MILEVAAGAALIGGGVASGVAAVWVKRDRVAGLTFAAALGCAGAAMLTAQADVMLMLVACVFAAAGIVQLVVDRAASVTILSWLDAAMGGSATAALILTLG